MNTYTQSHIKARHAGMVAHVYNPGLRGIWLLRPPNVSYTVSYTVRVRA